MRLTIEAILALRTIVQEMTEEQASRPTVTALKDLRAFPTKRSGLDSTASISMQHTIQTLVFYMNIMQIQTRMLYMNIAQSTMQTMVLYMNIGFMLRAFLWVDVRNTANQGHNTPQFTTAMKNSVMEGTIEGVTILNMDVGTTGGVTILNMDVGTIGGVTLLTMDVIGMLMKMTMLLHEGLKALTDIIVSLDRLATGAVVVAITSNLPYVSDQIMATGQRAGAIAEMPEGTSALLTRKRSWRAKPVVARHPST